VRRQLVGRPRVEQRDGAARAARVEHEAVREIGREDVAVEAEAGAPELEAAVEVVVAVRVVAEVGHVAELRLERRLQREVPVVALDEEPLVVPRAARAELAAPVGVGEDVLLRRRLRARLDRLVRFDSRDARLQLGQLLLQLLARRLRL
jgi:hypothetical protein